MFIKLIENNGKQFIFGGEVLNRSLSISFAHLKRWFSPYSSRAQNTHTQMTAIFIYRAREGSEMNVWTLKFASFSTGHYANNRSIKSRSLKLPQIATDISVDIIVIGWQRNMKHLRVSKWNEKCHAANWCQNIYTNAFFAFSLSLEKLLRSSM